MKHQCLFFCSLHRKLSFWVVLACGVFLLNSCNTSSTKKGESNEENITQNEDFIRGEMVYKNYCAGCHGRELQGSVAPALVSVPLKYGSSRDSILQSIHDGIPSTEMIAWDGVLSSEEMESVTDYIVQVRQSPDLISIMENPLEIKTKDYTLKIEELVKEEIEKPWGIAFVDKHTALITENKGELRWLRNGNLDPKKITGLPRTYAYDAFGGMMDVTVDPNYSENGWVYLALSSTVEEKPDSRSSGMTKIVRGKIKDYQWVDEQILFQVPESLTVSGGTRWGCKFLIDNRGYLYFTIGDMNRADDSQDLSKPTGKIYRIHLEGSTPKGNPYNEVPGAIEAIYTYGNRNAQGIAQHPETGVIYSSEHGPQGGDELNIINKGANYGWPVITYGIEYDGSIITHQTHKEGMEQPIIHWTPSIAVSAIDFVKGDVFSKWKNNLLVGSLKFEEVRRLEIAGDRVIEEEILLQGYGRIRDIKIGPDGSMYLLTHTPDAVLRITPL